MATKTKTEFQEALQALIDRGDLDLRNKKTIHYPMHFNEDFENRLIEELTDDVRTLNALRRSAIMTFKDLIEKWYELGKIRNMGSRSVAVARNSLMDKYYKSLDVNEKAKFLGEIIKINNGTVVIENVEV